MRIHNFKFQQRVFWCGLILGVGIVSAGFLAEALGSYSLLDYRGIKFGSYGFNLAQIPKRENLDGKKVVVLLGNSVYQYGSIPSLMKNIAEERGDNVVLMNMSQVSATIYDYLIQAAKIVHYRPDLVVVNIYYWTYFTTPRFATDCDQMAFDPQVRRALPPSFYTRYFDFRTAVSSMISTAIPLKRIDPILRWEFKLRERLPEWFLKWTSYPHLNIPVERGEFNYIQRMSLTSQEEQIRTEEILQTQQELMDIFRRFHIPVLFIWQEASTEEDSDVLKAIDAMIQQDENAMSVYYKDYWNDDLFDDSVHPGKNEVDRYALRHYNAIVQALEHFEKQKGTH